MDDELNMYCQCCGAETTRRGLNQKYCPECADEIKRVQKNHHGYTPVEHAMAHCTICGTEFRAANSKHVYCSEDCAEEGRRQNAKIYYAKWAGVLKANGGKRPDLDQKPCRECGELFQPIRTTQVFCCSACRVTATQRRDRESRARNRAEADKLRASKPLRKKKEPEQAPKQCMTAGLTITEMALVARENRMSYGKLQGLIAANGGALPGYIRVPELSRARERNRNRRLAYQ